MTLRHDIDGLRRQIGTPGDCPGALDRDMTTFRQGEPEPEPPLCELCGQQHWPEGHLVVCEVIVTTREEAARYTDSSYPRN
jgi:hypothetical protein